MLSHVLSNIPSSQNRAVHVKVQGGVKICGSRNLVVSGGRVDGKRAVERIGMVREGIDRVPMGGISEDWVGAGRKRRAEEVSSSAVKKCEAGMCSRLVPSGAEECEAGEALRLRWCDEWVFTVGNRWKMWRRIKKSAQ